MSLAFGARLRYPPGFHLLHVVGGRRRLKVPVLLSLMPVVAPNRWRNIAISFAIWPDRIRYCGKRQVNNDDLP